MAVVILPAGSAGAGAKLHVTHWLPEGRPRAIILLAHGYAEHAGRYAYVAKRLTDAGYAVYAVDHWGHGNSDGEGGFVPRFSAFLDGMAELLTLVEVNHADTPRLTPFESSESTPRRGKKRDRKRLIHTVKRDGGSAGRIAGPDSAAATKAF